MVKDWIAEERRARKNSWDEIEVVLKRQKRFFPLHPQLSTRDADIAVSALKGIGVWEKILEEEFQ